MAMLAWEIHVSPKASDMQSLLQGYLGVVDLSLPTRAQKDAGISPPSGQSPPREQTPWLLHRTGVGERHGSEVFMFLLGNVEEDRGPLGQQPASKNGPKFGGTHCYEITSVFIYGFATCDFSKI